uniref:glutathione gamma-glutamylcysteinyltransferase n=1 Tax=Macrostomum lignano TaxID=282301 RepID=A0A1I8JNM6_9PLAT
MCRCMQPLHEMPPKRLTLRRQRIGQLIAEKLVADGSTLQTGIGSIPDAVLASLKGHKNSAFTQRCSRDGVVDLTEWAPSDECFEANKTWQNVSGFVIGTKKVFDFIDENAMVEAVAIISQNPRVTAINSCIEIDLTGQVVSDSIDPHLLGVGGQIDFMRGAALSSDGLGVPIIALQSSTKEGRQQDCAVHSEAPVFVTTRAHVHYVVTEHGIAHLSIGVLCLATVSRSDSAEGKAIFQEALKTGNMEGYFRLASQFVTQDHPAYCGLATLVMCLNSLEVDPGRVWKGPWRWFHEEMLDCCVPLSKSAQFRHHNERVEQLVMATEAASIRRVRAGCQVCSQSEEKILVVSYGRQGLDQTGDGHFALSAATIPSAGCCWLPAIPRLLHFDPRVRLSARTQNISHLASLLSRRHGHRRPGVDDLRCPTRRRISVEAASRLRRPGPRRRFDDADVDANATSDTDWLATFAAAAGHLRGLCETLRLRELPIGRNSTPSSLPKPPPPPPPPPIPATVSMKKSTNSSRHSALSPPWPRLSTGGSRFRRVCRLAIPVAGGVEEATAGSDALDEAEDAEPAAGDPGMLALALLMSWPLTGWSPAAGPLPWPPPAIAAMSDLPAVAVDEMRTIQRRLGSLIRPASSVLQLLESLTNV